MEKRCIHPEGAAPPAAPYTPAVAAGNLLFCSGVVCLKADGSLANGSLEEEIHQCFANLKVVLGGAGLDLTQVVKMSVYLDDMGNFADLNSVYGEYFPKDPPARTCVEVAVLPLDVRVELEAIALLPK
jgi:2-iminobutanoate/2-iminopropanoate deaminase